MKHQAYRRLLSRLIDQDLNERERVLIERHLRECAECAHVRHQWEALCRDLQDWEAPPLRPFFAQRVMAAYRVAAKERFWSLFEWVPRPIILTGLALSIVLIILCLPVPYQTASDNGSPWAQLYSAQTVTVPESDEQTLALVIRNGHSEFSGDEQ